MSVKFKFDELYKYGVGGIPFYVVRVNEELGCVRGNFKSDEFMVMKDGCIYFVGDGNVPYAPSVLDIDGLDLFELCVRRDGDFEDRTETDDISDFGNCGGIYDFKPVYRSTLLTPVFEGVDYVGTKDDYVIEMVEDQSATGEGMDYHCYESIRKIRVRHNGDIYVMEDGVDMLSDDLDIVSLSRLDGLLLYRICEKNDDLFVEGTEREWVAYGLD